MAEALVQAWDKTWMEQGEYLEVLRTLAPEQGWQAQCTVEVVANKDGFRYPAHSRDFPLWCYQTAPDLILGFIPTLGLEASAATLEQLQSVMADNVRLEFVRKGRLKDASRLVETAWFQEFTWKQTPVKLNFYTPAELEGLGQQKDKPLLQQVAEKLYPALDEPIDLEQELEQLANSLNSTFRQNVLLLGPNGCGKTALLSAYVKRRRKLRQKPIWETSAARLVQGLTGDVGWQKNLALLCRELREQEDILYVNHLHELFEVGQYAGNEVSIGDALARAFATR